MAGARNHLGQPAFVLVLPFRPASFQAGGKAKYEARLRQEVNTAFAGREAFRGSLYVRITHLHRVKTRRADLDNIIKPILDAMKGTVFSDDSMVRQCIAASIYLPEEYTVAEKDRPSAGYDELTHLIDDTSNEHFVYVEVGLAPTQLISFGPLKE